jgi:exopolysaccharide biosynthesis polyprenyl glycosylphosphotransferase
MASSLLRSDSPGTAAPSLLDKSTRTNARRRGSGIPALSGALLCSDIVALGLALLGYALLWRPPALGTAAIPLAIATVAVTIAVGHALRLYENDRRRPDHATADEIFALFQAVTITAWLLFAFALLAGAPIRADPGFVGLWVLAIALLFCGRVLTRALRHRVSSHAQRTVIVGTGKVAHAIGHKLVRNPRLGLELVGFVDEDPLERDEELSDIPVLGEVAHIEELVATLDVERAIVAFSGESDDLRLLGLLRSLNSCGVQVDVVPRLFESVGLRASLHALEGLPLISLTPPTPARPSLELKRVGDAALACLGLLVLAPLLAIVALAIKLDSPGPVLYFSERVGRGGRRFQLCKFRTMHTQACRGTRYGAARAEELFEEIMDDPAHQAEFERTHKLRNDPRVTRLGSLLRRTSLDELPQLVNVIRGDLSLVGPRTVMAYEVEKLNLIAQGELERARDSLALSCPLGYWELDWLRPGVTGYWQVTARSDVGYEERLRLDLIYTTSWSLKLDLKIMLRTLGALAGRGAY